MRYHNHQMLSHRKAYFLQKYYHHPELPERFLSPILMDWLDKYISKRTAELQHQITKSKWQQTDLESILSKLHNQPLQDTDKK